jgi:hypothetical protein
MRETAIVCNNEHEVRYIYLMLTWKYFDYFDEDDIFPMYITKWDDSIMFRGKVKKSKFIIHGWITKDSKKWNNKNYRLVQAKNISKKDSENLFD